MLVTTSSRSHSGVPPAPALLALVAALLVTDAASAQYVRSDGVRGRIVSAGTQVSDTSGAKILIPASEFAGARLVLTQVCMQVISSSGTARPFLSDVNSPFAVRFPPLQDQCTTFEPGLAWPDAEDVELFFSGGGGATGSFYVWLTGVVTDP